MIVLGFTGSRGSLIGAIGGLATVALVYGGTTSGPNIHMKKIIFSSIVTTVGSLVLLMSVDTAPLERMLMWDYRTTIAVRLEGNWLPALRSFGDRPLFGFGFALSGEVWAENYYLRLLAEHGIIGFIIFFLLLTTLVKETAVNLNLNAKFRPVALGYLGSIVGILLASVAADKFLVVRLATPFWLIGGLLVGNALTTHREN